MMTNTFSKETSCAVQDIKFQYIKSSLKTCVFNLERIDEDYSAVTLQNTTNIEGFLIRDRKYLGFLPLKLGRAFSGLKAIEVSGCSFKIMRAKYFTHLPGLISINLPHNEIKEIESGVFANKPNLKYLSLANNKLRSLDAKIFRSLTNLSTLYLHNNLLTFLDHNLLKYLINLNTIIIADNELKTLSEDFFEDNKKLETIWLGGNKIDSLSPTMFRNKASLRIVDLTNNLCIGKKFQGSLATDAKFYETLSSKCAPLVSSTPEPNLVTSPSSKPFEIAIPGFPNLKKVLIIVGSLADVICSLTCVIFLYQYSQN